MIRYELDFFAGAGGGILGGILGGVQCVGAVEWEAYPASVLCLRQNEGILPPFPIWSDVRSFTKRNNACRRFIRSLRAIRHELRLAGGFPCQDISSAGKGAGIDGERSSMWIYLARAIGEIRPGEVWLENSPLLVGRGLIRVLGDLAALGYDARWGVVGAADAIWSDGTPCFDHERLRIWLIARPNSKRSRLEGFIATSGKPEESKSGELHFTPSDSLRVGCRQMECEDSGGEAECRPSCEARKCSLGGGRASWWKDEPRVDRVADGVAARVDRIKAIGNGQVPHLVEFAIDEILEQL